MTGTFLSKIVTGERELLSVDARALAGNQPERSDGTVPCALHREAVPDQFRSASADEKHLNFSSDDNSEAFRRSGAACSPAFLSEFSVLYRDSNPAGEKFQRGHDLYSMGWWQ